MAHTSRCEDAAGPATDCHCSCGGLLHGGTAAGRWWRPAVHAVRSGMSPIPAPRGADVVQAGIEALHLVHQRDRRALLTIRSAITTTTDRHRRRRPEHWLCAVLVELARTAMVTEVEADPLTDELWTALAAPSFGPTFTPSPATVLRIGALLSCPDPARHPGLERTCIRPLARQLPVDIAVS